LEAFSAGTLAGAGSFRCEDCGYAIALQELDELPECPHCGGEEFHRSSIFEAHTTAEPLGPQETKDPDWLAEARDALVRPGDYVAFDDGNRVRVVALQEGWTRVGRGLSAHLRIDDPTVSRRHALVHCEEGAARVLDDRSLNGVFLNGERIDWHELQDGDEIAIGAFRLFYIRSTEGAADHSERVGSAVG
jgi:predicted RNA-binding Zn-ribbon protein involved in translation (DUF1610 family)